MDSRQNCITNYSRTKDRGSWYASAPQSPHVHWGSLPRPDRETSYRSSSEFKSIAPPAYSMIARRRACEAAEERSQQREQSDGAGRRKSRGFDEATPDFHDPEWIDPPHPGLRVPVDLTEDEAISPKSEATYVPDWNTQMHTEKFRAMVQPQRFTGRRKPGMTGVRR